MPTISKVNALNAVDALNLRKVRAVSHVLLTSCDSHHLNLLYTSSLLLLSFYSPFSSTKLSTKMLGYSTQPFVAYPSLWWCPAVSWTPTEDVQAKMCWYWSWVYIIMFCFVNNIYIYIYDFCFFNRLIFVGKHIYNCLWWELNDERQLSTYK